MSSEDTTVQFAVHRLQGTGNKLQGDATQRRGGTRSGKSVPFESIPDVTRLGVVPRQGIRAAYERGWIRSSAPIPERNLQPASMDLTLGTTAHRLRCSFLPGGQRVADRLNEY